MEQVPIEKALLNSVARQSRPVNYFQSETLADLRNCNRCGFSNFPEFHGVGELPGCFAARPAPKQSAGDLSGSRPAPSNQIHSKLRSATMPGSSVRCPLELSAARCTT